MKNNPYIKIKNLKIGYDYPPVVISELGINHNGNLKKAIYLVDEAIKSGAQIIKHQTHIPEEEMSIEAKKIIPDHINTSIFNIIKKCSLSEKDEFALKKYVESKKKIFISTPFSFAAVDRLKKFNVPAIKIGSGECNNYPLIEYICKLKKPIILSTGMNSISSIRPSVKIIEKNKIPYALLHCTNIYPTPNHLIRINALEVMKKKFPNAVLGLSDHSASIYPAIASVILGASLIEKHFTDTKKRTGADISASMDKKELKNLNEAIKIVYQARGFEKKPLKEEVDVINFAFASIVSKKEIKKGEELKKSNITLKRPSTGDYGPKDYKKLLGRKVKRDIKYNTQIKKIDIAQNEK
jgi:N-acetylneuraminate synthase|tara:strand:+ start:1468 stop:2526 length:1059 start_codon:yes stop_codon:yes gene_type:complete